jgi:hypothetical protein
MNNLKSALLDLLHEIDDTEIRLILGGGYGIYLKGEYIRQNGIRTLFTEKPELRSTNDLDLFLRPELLIHPDKLKPLEKAITKLGYSVIKGAENYQFVKPGPNGDEAGSVKIDILTGPQKAFDGTTVKTDERRARPNPSIGIHAHPVNESPTLEEGLLVVPVEGILSSGKPWKEEISLPHPYTYLMMKLFAFRDRRKDPDKELGRYHALDLYSILANTTETEWEQAQKLKARFQKEDYVVEAGQIVSDYFSKLDLLGMIRLRESKYYRAEFRLTEFMSAIQELFPHSA